MMMIKVNIILKNVWHYTGQVIRDDNSEVVIKDIKGDEVRINKDEISVLRVLKRERNDFKKRIL
jgi:hypothetical protein